MIQWSSPGAVIGPADLFLLWRNVFALPTTPPPPPEAPEAEAEVLVFVGECRKALLRSAEWTEVIE